MKILLRFGLVAIVLVGLLSIPAPEREIAPSTQAVPFVWNQDSVWTALEQHFVDSREAGCELVTTESREAIRSISDALEEIETRVAGPGDLAWDQLELALFETGAQVAACPEVSSDYVPLTGRVRQVAKRQSRQWDLSTTEARARLYRLLYGGRAAAEEVISQIADSSSQVQLLALQHGIDEESPVPSAVVRGVRIQSGDLLVSRGGYPTSALISRGSDYPGNFSHVALAYVTDEAEVFVIEAHIEGGVAIASADEYLNDKKLRLMVLRLRADHPVLVEDPMASHRAARYSFERASDGHVPYDFEMNYQDPARLFCSEVASDAYNQVGITLWTGISTISSAGLRNWLGAFGVKYFETQEPSDLEYDPQLVVVAEWRDPETLRMDRIDNAVVDALLETAERGARLGYDWYQLAPGRLAKGYSVAKNIFGRTGPVPEGMNAAAALRNRAYSDRHDQLSATLAEEAKRFVSENGYQPPYWRLLDLARIVVEQESVPGSVDTEE